MTVTNVVTLLVAAYLFIGLLRSLIYWKNLKKRVRVAMIIEEAKSHGIFNYSLFMIVMFVYFVLIWPSLEN